jgi:hypothetical protein
MAAAVPAANMFRTPQVTRLPLQKRAAIAEVLFLVQSKRVVGEAPTTAREARALPGKTQSAISSLPLDCARWFGRDIVNDAVNTFDFIHDAVGDAGK